MRKAIVGSVLFIGFCSSAFAYTECMTKLARVYAGDNNSLALSADSAPGAFVNPTNASYKMISATALLAVSADKIVVIRYAADGVPCSSGVAARSDIQGLWVVNR